jgi:hypothetical protein
MKMISESQLTSRMGATGRNELPAWLIEGEYRGLGIAAMLKGLEENGSEQKPVKKRAWNLPRIKEART